MRSLIKGLILHGSIKTTRAKAKTVQSEIERLISKSKKNDVNAHRRVYSELGNDRKSMDIFFKNVLPSFSEKVGGYTRVVYLPRRRGDFAQTARIEWTKDIPTAKTAVKKTKKSPVTKKEKSKK